MMTLRRSLLGAAAALTLAPGLAAQEPARPGWIGVSFDVSAEGRPEGPTLTITVVSPGSPAAAAGIRPGDALVAVNDLDTPQELTELTRRLRLRVGDPVHMVVVRDGRRREFRMTAAQPPESFVATREVRWSTSPDSVVETMVRSMDSLRIRLVQARGPRAVAVAPAAPSVEVSVVTRSGDPAGAPFEFFVFRDERHDSLTREMDELLRTRVELERRLEALARTRERDARAARVRRPARDEESERLVLQMEEVSARFAELRSAMAVAAREAAGLGNVEPTLARDLRADADPAVESGRVRGPLAPYILGRNRVAGAEVLDLRPALAAYFQGVASGVLVVDVAPRTPAAIAGIEPGDVLTRVDRVAVRTVDDLRLAISRADGAVPLTLMRHGRALQVLLRR